MCGASLSRAGSSNVQLRQAAKTYAATRSCAFFSAGCSSSWKSGSVWRRADGVRAGKGAAGDRGRGSRCAPSGASARLRLLPLLLLLAKMATAEGQWGLRRVSGAALVSFLSREGGAETVATVRCRDCSLQRLRGTRRGDGCESQVHVSVCMCVCVWVEVSCVMGV